MKNHLLFISLFIQLSVFAQPGSLDNTFGTGGKLITDFGGNDIGSAVIIQPDGKIIVAGNSDTDTSAILGSVFALTRYNSDGTLDNTFDIDGKVTTDFGTATATGKAMCLQSDGKIVVVGYSYNGSDNDLALARYNTNGSLDNSFDSDGKVITDFGTSDEAFAIAIQTDGKIVVAGVSYFPLDQDFAVYRYNSNGSLDISFDSDGKQTTDFAGSFDVAYSLVIQGDGKTVLAGYAFNGVDNNMGLARYNTNGSLDNSFDSDGKVITDFGGDDLAKSIVIQSDGKLVVGGFCDTGIDIDFALARYYDNGTLDNTFDTDGKVTTDFGGLVDVGYSVAMQNDGKIILAGASRDSISNYNFALARYNSNGSLDNTFDSDGKLITLFGVNEDYGCSVAIQTDSKIVVAGMSNDGFLYDFALARYHFMLTGSETVYAEQTLSIQPNPSSGIFTLNLKQQTCDTKICIYDIVGKCVLNKNIQKASNMVIDLSNHPQGVYFIEMVSNGKKTVKKVILN